MLQNCKIAVYYRVSTAAQDFASQKEDIEEWLKYLHPKPKSVQVFEDHGVSGATPLSLRPGYQRLSQAVSKRKIDTVVVYKLDRLSRKSIDAIHEICHLQQSGVGFIAVSQPYLDLSLRNPFRQTLLAVFSDMAEMERINIRDRVNSGLKAAKARGVRLGRPPKCDSDLLARLKELKSYGLSQREMAKRLGVSAGSVNRYVKLLR